MQHLGWCFIYIFVAYANIHFIYLGRWQGRRGCANEHFNKATENATKTAEINKKPPRPFSFSPLGHAPRESKPQIINIFRTASPVRSWQRINQKTGSTKVPHVPKRFAALGCEQNCWAKTSSKEVVNISGRNILTAPHFLPQLSPVKLRTGLSAEGFNEVVKCAEIF